MCFLLSDFNPHCPRRATCRQARRGCEVPGAESQRAKRRRPPLTLALAAAPASPTSRRRAQRSRSLSRLLDVTIHKRGDTVRAELSGSGESHSSPHTRARPLGVHRGALDRRAAPAHRTRPPPSRTPGRRAPPRAARDRGAAAGTTTNARFREERPRGPRGREDLRAWDVQILGEDDWLSFARRCPPEASGRFLAASLKRERLRDGWTEAT